eukprot:364478-Chlamydomonas_euryale.AAC.10
MPCAACQAGMPPAGMPEQSAFIPRAGDAATPSLADGTTRDRTNGKLPGSAGAPGSPYGDAGSGGSDSRDSDDEETEWDDGERLVDSADTAGAIGAGGRASKSDVLQVLGDGPDGLGAQSSRSPSCISKWQGASALRIGTHLLASSCCGDTITVLGHSPE